MKESRLSSQRYAIATATYLTDFKWHTAKLLKLRISFQMMMMMTMMMILVSDDLTLFYTGRVNPKLAGKRGE